jgi:hypothetical protein
MTDVHTLVGAYVLDAVDDGERAAVESHLVDCPVCHAEVDELRVAAARLADGTWSVPPPRMRTTVLSSIGGIRQEPPARRAGRDGRATPRWRVVAAAAAAAGVLAASAASVTYLVQERRVGDERATAVAARRQGELVQTLLGASDATVRRGVLAGGGQVTVVSSAQRDGAVVVLADAPTIPADRAYQLWLMDGATPRSAGLFAAGASDATAVIRGVAGKAAVAVSVEPAAGSTAPTTQPLVGVPLR